MDPVVLARVLFASTAGLHFLFVVTTLGLAPIIAVLATRQAAAPQAERGTALKVLSRLYVINYAVGIVTGMVMELQMGLVWTGPGALIYDPIATMLGLETILAFFLESILLGLWLVGDGILGPKVRAAIFWGVTATAYLSATFIIGANSYLHHPLDLGADPLSMADVLALVVRPASLTVLGHVASVSLVAGGFWAASAGARVIRRGGDAAVGARLIKLGVRLVAVVAPLAVVSGVLQFSAVRPRFTSAGWFGAALAAMMLVGVLVTLATWLLMMPLAQKGVLMRSRFWLTALANGVAIPVAVTFLGWLYREEARQPWFVLDRVKVSDAIAPIPAAQLLVMCVGFIGLGVTAAATAWILMARAAHTNPAPSPAADTVSRWT